MIDLILYPILVGIIIYGIIITRVIMNYQKKEILKDMKMEAKPEPKKDQIPAAQELPTVLPQSPRHIK